MKKYVKADKSRSITQEVLDYCKTEYPNLYKELSEKDIWINMWSDGEYSLSYSLLKPEYYLSDSAAEELVKVVEELYPGSYWGDVDACEDATSIAKPKYFATMVNCSSGIDDNSEAVRRLREYLANYQAEIVDTWETTDDGVYALINEWGSINVLRYKNGHIYNVNNDDCEVLAKLANE